MTFNDIFSLNGHFLTYRDFRALTLGSNAAVVILTGAVVSVVLTKFGGRGSATMKLVES
jgi:hypothetical protein